MTSPAPLERAVHRGQQLRAVADDRDRLARAQEVAHQVQHRGVAPQVLRRAGPCAQGPSHQIGFCQGFKFANPCTRSSTAGLRRRNSGARPLRSGPFTSDRVLPGFQIPQTRAPGPAPRGCAAGTPARGPCAQGPSHQIGFCQGFKFAIPCTRSSTAGLRRRNSGARPLRTGPRERHESPAIIS